MYCLIKAFHYWINKQKYIYNICTPSWMCLFSLLDWKNICAHLLLTTGWCCCAVSLHLIIYYIDFHLFISLILTVIYYTHTHVCVNVTVTLLIIWSSALSKCEVSVGLNQINKSATSCFLSWWVFPMTFIVFILSEWYFLSHKSSHKPFCILIKS